VATLDGILAAYYEVVSGPAGTPRQWERDDSLHLPGAQVMVVEDGEGGRPVGHKMTLAEFHRRSDPLVESGFYEREIHRVVQRHGAVAHVWSTYEWQRSAEGPAEGQGVNSIQLFHDGERWWITSWIYDGRHGAPPVAAEYLPEGEAGEAAEAASQPDG
jgi:hypothetical protein